MVEQREKLLHQHAKATYQWKTSEKSSEAPAILIFHLPGFLYKTFGGSWVLFNISPSPPKTYQAAGGQPDTPTQHHAPLKPKPSTQFQSIQDLGTTISHQTSINTICLNLLQISSFQRCSYKRRAITIFQNLSNATKKPVQTPRSPLKVRMWTLIFTPSRTQRCSSPSGLPSCTKTERERRWSSTKHIHNQCTEKFLVSRRKHGRPWCNTIPPESVKSIHLSPPAVLHTNRTISTRDDPSPCTLGTANSGPDCTSGKVYTAGLPRYHTAADVQRLAAWNSSLGIHLYLIFT